MQFAKKLSFFLHYLSNPPWDTGVSPPELVAFAASHTPGKALELGCGTGTNAIYLAKHGWQATAVDFVPSAIARARRKAGREGVAVRFLVDDVTRLQTITGPFDLILDIGCYHSLPEKERRAYQRNIIRLLDPQGFFLLYSMVSETGDEFGLTISDLKKLQQSLELIDRQDGKDRGRRSAWFTWRTLADPSPVQ
jgi:SAM-dependent methyltransferase